MKFSQVFLCGAALLAFLQSPSSAQAAEGMMSFNFKNAELADVIGAYAKASGKKFVVDASVRGKVNTIVPNDVSIEEGFNLLNDSLSLNGFSIVENGDVTVVMSARNAQRDKIPTVTTAPPSRPNRMMTMIYTPKHLDIQELMKRLRILPSRDGEMSAYDPSNAIIFSDYASNLNRIAELLGKIDVPQISQNKPTKTDQKNSNKLNQINQKPEAASPKSAHQ